MLPASSVSTSVHCEVLLPSLMVRARDDPERGEYTTVAARLPSTVTSRHGTLHVPSLTRTSTPSSLAIDSPSTALSTEP